MIKPRTGLQQHSELQRKTPLRRTEFKRGGALPVKPRKTGLKPDRPSGEQKRCMALLPVRSGGVCETQVPGACRGRAEVPSHRKRRSQSSKAEKWSPTNVLHNCAPCEDHLTDKGATPAVRSKGWTVHPSLDPAAVPVLRRGVYVWLHEDGTYTECDLSELAAWVLQTTGEVA